MAGSAFESVCTWTQLGIMCGIGWKMFGRFQQYLKEYIKVTINLFYHGSVTSFEFLEGCVEACSKVVDCPKTPLAEFVSRSWQNVKKLAQETL